MALSPNHVVRLLSFDDTARLLAGVRPEQIQLTPEEMRSFVNWQCVLVDALLEGSIEPTGNIRVLDEQSGEELNISAIWLEDFDPMFHKIKAMLRREDLYGWLKDLSIPDEDIPEALRISPSKVASKAQDQSRTGEGEELRTLEALGLLVETFAKQEAHTRKYRVGEAGRPNCAQIAKAMNNQAGDVYGMSESKLQRLLSKALTTWQEKCK